MKITEKQKQQLNNMCVVAKDVKLGDIITELEGGTSTEIQVDWNETNVDSPAYIKNKPDISKEEVEKQSEDIAKLNTNATLTQRTVQVLTEDLSTANSEIAILKNTSAGKKDGNKEVFNDYETNVSNTIFSHVEGTNNKARIGIAHVEGRNNNLKPLKGFKMIQKSEDYNEKNSTGSVILDSTEGIKVNDTWTIFIKDGADSWKYRGTILSIDSANNKVVVLASKKDWDFTVAEATIESPYNWFFVNGGLVGSTEILDNSGAFSTHVEGSNGVAFFNSHCEGRSCEATGYGSHAEGYYTIASGERAHSENYKTVACGHESHAEGMTTKAKGYASHTEGECTIASGRSQHVEGSFNIEDTNDTYLHIIGNGKNEKTRSNAMTVDWQGNGWFAGNVTIGENKYKLVSEEKVGQIESLLTQDKTTLVAVIKDLQDRIIALENK